MAQERPYGDRWDEGTQSLMLGISFLIQRTVTLETQESKISSPLIGHSYKNLISVKTISLSSQ